MCINVCLRCSEGTDFGPDLLAQHDSQNLQCCNALIATGIWPLSDAESACAPACGAHVAKQATATKVIITTKAGKPPLLHDSQG